MKPAKANSQKGQTQSGGKSSGAKTGTKKRQSKAAAVNKGASETEAKSPAAKTPAPKAKANVGKNVAGEKQAAAQKSTAKQAKVTTTLAVDIGGSGVKALLLNEQGAALNERDRIKTPKPATPDAVIAVIEELAGRQQGQFDRVSVGFPGVVSKGVVWTAVNLHPDWEGVSLATELAERLGTPVRVANDADIQGMGAIAGQGVELVVTLGTGFGSALFTDGLLVPNLELAHHRFRKGETYEEQLGRAALKKVGQKTWNARLLKAINSLSKTLNYDRLYIGGGEVKQIKGTLPENVTVVSNVLGLLGGIHLWND